MEKRHKHVSPTLDIMAKKIFSLPEVTVAFIRDILDLDVVDAQILEGTQLHKKDFDEDELFSTSVDVRAKFNDGAEVIIKMYEQMEPVYGIAILEKTLLPDEESPINTYWMANSRTGKPLYSFYKDGKQQNLLQIAFLELGKYNKDKHIRDEGRQWLEFFGNLPFSMAPSQAVTHADSLLDSSSWTQEEKAMIDERIRIQENYDMTMETAIDEAREEGIEKGLEQGLERGLKQGLERGRHEERLELIRKMLSKGLSLEVVSDVTGLSLEELEGLVS